MHAELRRTSEQGRRDIDACLLANLLCRLPDPSACLARLSGPDGLVKPGGIAVVVSPYTWMEEHTPRQREAKREERLRHKEEPVDPLEEERARALGAR